MGYYGLLGRKLGHSRSPEIHALLADYEYRLFEREPEQLESFLKNTDFSGINVTIPYKQDVIPYLSEISQEAARIGAVNTVIRRSDGSLYGDNTDYYGFIKMLERGGASIAGKKCLVLGSGGASKTAVTALCDLQAASVTVISRSGEDNYENLYEKHKDAEILINATPVGMYPNVEEQPVYISGFDRLCGVYDVVYNPHPTKLIREAKKRGIPAEDGLFMLVAQAKKAAELFTEKSISEACLETVFSEVAKTL